RRISMLELIEAYESGKLEEAFGTGTAAVISPIGQLTFEGNNYIINDAETGSVAKTLYDTLTGIQYGHMEDPFNWITKVSESFEKPEWIYCRFQSGFMIKPIT